MNTIIPCTPLAVVELIKRTGTLNNFFNSFHRHHVSLGVKTKGKNAVICGRSKNVGMPIAMLLHSDGTGSIVYSCNYFAKTVPQEKQGEWT